MTRQEKQLTVYLLKLAADQFGNHGCNDIPEEVFSGWSEQERNDLSREYHQYNGDPHEYEEGHYHLPDFALMSFMASKLRQEIMELDESF